MENRRLGSPNYKCLVLFLRAEKFFCHSVIKYHSVYEWLATALHGDLKSLKEI